MELLLERGDRALDLPRARADRARNPVERAQLVDDRAADARHREGLELDLAVGVEALDRADEAEQPVRDEILLVHVRRQARPDATGDELHEWRVGQDQPVAEVLIVRLAVLLPERLGLVRSSHGKRIRRGKADSSGATPDRAHAARGRPSRLRARRGERDHPRAAALERGENRDEAEPERQRGEEEPEKRAAARAECGARPVASRATLAAQLRGVAQLAERWSPKPEVAGSIPVAPVSPRARSGIRRLWLVPLMCPKRLDRTRGLPYEM